MKTFTLHLIRHGLTQGNLDGLYVGGGTDLPLCDEGRAQLEELCGRFEYPQPQLVFTSPLLRATQTADILFPAARKLAIDQLREAGFGVFEGRKVSSWFTSRTSPAGWTPPPASRPGAEPTAQFHRRCGETLMKLFEYMIRSGTEEAACVTHGGVIMSMLAQKALPQRKPEDWMADPGAGYTLRTDTTLWMRDGIVEAVDIVPFGYLDDQPDD